MTITPYEFDSNLFLTLNGDGGWFIDQIMWYASAKLTWVPLYALIIWWIWRTKGLEFTVRFIIAALLTVLFADQTATFFKDSVSKFRPTHYPPLDGLVRTVNGYLGGLYGTISSHAANSAGIALISAMVIRKRWVSWSLVAWVMLVSYSRIYLGVHYPMDILLGLLEGSFWGFSLWYIIKRVRTGRCDIIDKQ